MRFRAARSAWGGKVVTIAALMATASCGMLIGIEDLNQGGGPDGAGGGADASAGRGGTGAAREPARDWRSAGSGGLDGNIITRPM
jgi:hypothetical protein